MHEYIKIALKGTLMGTADIIPGVSGGTVALLVGVYERLINVLSGLGLQTVKDALTAVRTKNLGPFMRTYDLFFLGSLLCGIALAIVTAARFIPALMESHRSEMNALFFGLILASAAVPMRLLKVWRNIYVGLLIVAAGLAFWLVGLPVATGSDNPLVLFVSGAIAICAMILPGVSGSYLLKTMGQYEHILTAVHEREVVTLVIVMGGMLVGILSFVRVLRYLLSRHHDATMMVLTGLMLGSLRSVWPWRESWETTSALFSPHLKGDGLLWMVFIVLGGVIVVALIAAEEKFGDKPTLE